MIATPGGGGIRTLIDSGSWGTTGRGAWGTSTDSGGALTTGGLGATFDDTDLGQGDDVRGGGCDMKVVVGLIAADGYCLGFTGADSNRALGAGDLGVLVLNALVSAGRGASLFGVRGGGLLGTDAGGVGGPCAYGGCIFSHGSGILTRTVGDPSAHDDDLLGAQGGGILSENSSRLRVTHDGSSRGAPSSELLGTGRGGGPYVKGGGIFTLGGSGGNNALYAGGGGGVLAADSNSGGSAGPGVIGGCCGGVGTGGLDKRGCMLGAVRVGIEVDGGTGRPMVGRQQAARRGVRGAGTGLCRRVAHKRMGGLRIRPTDAPDGRAHSTRGDHEGQVRVHP
jgi:hypothetical protein